MGLAPTSGQQPAACVVNFCQLTAVWAMAALWLVCKDAIAPTALPRYASASAPERQSCWASRAVCSCCRVRCSTNLKAATHHQFTHYIINSSYIVGPFDLRLPENVYLQRAARMYCHQFSAWFSVTLVSLFDSSDSPLNRRAKIGPV